jgi:hypothetical protein
LKFKKINKQNKQNFVKKKVFLCYFFSVHVEKDNNQSSFIYFVICDNYHLEHIFLIWFLPRKSKNLACVNCLSIYSQIYFAWLIKEVGAKIWAVEFSFSFHLIVFNIQCTQYEKHGGLSRLKEMQYWLFWKAQFSYGQNPPRNCHLSSFVSLKPNFLNHSKQRHTVHCKNS